MKIYIVNGAAGAGKTAFEEMAATMVGEQYCKHISSIDFVKEIAYECGWDGAKTDKNRKFLSDLKDLLTRWDDVPLKKIKESIQFMRLAPIKPWCVFIDCREPFEIDKLKREFNAKAIIIRRNEAEKRLPSNHADENVLNYYYDYEINNNGDKCDLLNETEKFLKAEDIPIKIL